MIWIILGCLSVGTIFGYVICGLLTHSRIRDLENLLAETFDADAKEKREVIKFAREFFNPERLNERVRTQKSRTH